ncbi:acetoacetate decarboxylase family protein [Cytobacillus purgationiresistens]|uniref:Acetoacetate decarboxylase n=1 Tax=Cytobacillus purgationiresistens TaxID=863449 RepID=A0ABU0AEA9_9BACI|nr:acetoacetate decarboxylase family protein [Cytobacillus purgationiresistens]MDQ0269590.1 acetoacetate decarboxylase [Cytobacillus purgationiresistens]
MIKKSTSMPVHAPSFPDPFVPYESPDYVSLYAVVEVNEEELRRILSFTEFEYVSNQAVISVTDFSNCDKLSYMDCAIVVPIKYGDKYGGYYIYEYENNDAAISAGRELWGYPKKYADITLTEENGVYSGKVKKDEKVFLELTSISSEEAVKVEEPKITPHLNIRMIPNPGGGPSVRQIIERDTSPDFKLKDKLHFDVQLDIQSTKFEPLELLKPLKILGGGVVKGDFYATEENGWGKIISKS